MLDVTFVSRGIFTTALLIELPQIAFYYIANKTKKKINLFAMEWNIFSKLFLHLRVCTIRCVVVSRFPPSSNLFSLLSILLVGKAWGMGISIDYGP